MEQLRRATIMFGIIRPYGRGLQPPLRLLAIEQLEGAIHGTQGHLAAVMLALTLASAPS